MRLVEHYENRKKVLQPKLKKAKSKDEVVSVVKEELRTLWNPKGEYLGELSDSQTRIIATEVLTLLDRSFDLLKAMTVSILAEGTPRHFDTRHELASVGGATVGAMIGSVGGPPGSGAGALIGGVIVPRIVEGLEQEGIIKKQDSTAHRMLTNDIQLNVEVDKVLSYLEQAFKSIDRLVAIYDSKPKEVKHKATLEELSDVLKFFQELYGDAILDEKSDLPPLTQKRLKELPIILTHYGIEVKDYPKKGPSPIISEWPMFDFERSLDPNLQDYVTVQPALIKNGEVLRRGRVIKPASSAHS